MTAALPLKHYVTAAEFNRMAEAGIFGPEQRLELIEGEIFEMSPIGHRHASAVRRILNLLKRRLPDRYLVDAQDPVQISDLSQPQPDIAILRPSDDFYAEEHPGPEDAVLLVEVADTSLAYDRDVKAPLYARHGVAEVWIVDLNGRAVEVCRDGGADGYASVERFTDLDQRLSPVALPELELTVRELVG